MAKARPASLAREDFARAAALLKMLANKHRLVILASLMTEGELSVGELTARVGLSQSALSQHLACLRAGHVARQRRQSQTIYYSLADGMHDRLQPLLEKVLGPGFETRINP